MQAIKNTSGFRAVEYNVIVRPIEVEERTKGGLIVPEEVREKQQFATETGIVVSTSPFAFTYEDWEKIDGKPKPGDEVVFRRYAGTLRKGRDGVDYRIMTDKDIVAVMEAV